jgi:hypothetical protein
MNKTKIIVEPEVTDQIFEGHKYIHIYKKFSDRLQTKSLRVEQILLNLRFDKT